MRMRDIGRALTFGEDSGDRRQQAAEADTGGRRQRRQEAAVAGAAVTALAEM
jgi:hypothetical protein